MKKVFIEVGNKNHVPENDRMKKEPDLQKESEASGKMQEQKKEESQDVDDDSPKRGKKGKLELTHFEGTRQDLPVPLRSIDK